MYLREPSREEITATTLAQDFARDAAEHDRQGAFPHANVARLRASGLAALAVPRRFGGPEAGLATTLRIVNLIARGDPSIALVLAQQYLFHAAVRTSGRWGDALEARIFGSAVADGSLANMFRVEPELGTPIRGGLPATTARRVAGGWRLSGRKIFSTGAPGLAWNGVWARTDEPDVRVGSFVVPSGTPGLRIEETWDHLGMRATGSHDAVLEDVFVPDDHAGDLRPPAEWAARDPVQAAWAALLFSTIYDGVAHAARDWLVDFLKTRTPSNLGAPLATLPRMQEVVGQIEALLLTNRQLFALAEAVDRGQPPPTEQVYLAKYAISENAIAAVTKAVEVSGNPGLTRANPLERHLRDVLCARVHSPQADTCLIGAGKAALGM